MIAPTLTRFEEAISKVIESDSVTDIEQFMEALPVWIHHAIDWELVWHQSLRYDYFTVYFDSEYYFFNQNF